jgi:AraC-like DNA-binding protein
LPLNEEARQGARQERKRKFRNATFLSMPRANRTNRLVDAITYARLCRARDYLAAHYDRRITLANVAQVACLSPFHFHRLYVQTFGETPVDFLTRLRVDEATRRLATGRDSATEICLEVGYESLGTFSWRFRNLVGCSPSEYRRNFRRSFAIPSAWYIQMIPACFMEFYGSSQ